MDEKQSLILKENAYKDYIAGMKYKDIANKYSVSINTVKSWKRRLNWQRKPNTKKCARLQKVQELAKEIKQDLLNQLKENGTYGRHFEDLVNDYMELWDIKNKLIEDIKTKGVSIEWSNGKQFSTKGNDSIRFLNQTNGQMLKILTDLNLKPPKEPLEDDDGEM